MYLNYLDESGTPTRIGGTPCFVLLGLAIPATTWREKDAQVATLLDKHSLYAEIHTAWMARRYPEQERIAGFSSLSHVQRRADVERERKVDLGKAALRGQKAVSQLAKNYQKTAAYTHLTHAERLACLTDLADLIGGSPDAVIFADAQLKAAHSAGAPDLKIMEFAFEQVVSRFHHFLERAKHPVGLLVQDNNETAARRLTQLARAFHDRGTTWNPVGRLVETPLFVDSKLTSMVQLADLAAYATRRFFENSEVDLFDRVYPRFDRIGKKLVGLRHYTGKQKCACKVCKDHGR